MSDILTILYIFAALLLLTDLALLIKLVTDRVGNERQAQIYKQKKNELLWLITGSPAANKKKADIEIFMDAAQSMNFEPFNRQELEKKLNVEKSEYHYIKKLRSISNINRIEASVYLGAIASENSRIALQRAILREKNYSTKLYMANALSDIGNPRSIPILVETLLNSHRWYRDKVNMLISDFGEDFQSYLPQIIDSDRIEIMELIVDFASIYISDTLKNYLIALIEERNARKSDLTLEFDSFTSKCCANCIYSIRKIPNELRMCKFKGPVKPDSLCSKHSFLPVSYNAGSNFMQLVYKAAKTLSVMYPQIMIGDGFLDSADIEIKNTAILTLGYFKTEESIKLLIKHMQDSNTERSAINSISRIIETNPEYIKSLVIHFEKETNIDVRKGIATVLSDRIEYFLMKLTSDSELKVRGIVKEILLLGKTSQIIDFLNKNKNLDIENEILGLIKETIGNSNEIEREVQNFLDVRMLRKLGLKKHEPIKKGEVKATDRKLLKELYFMLGIVTILFPVIFLIRRSEILFSQTFLDLIRIYVLDFNYYVAFYSIIINLTYLMLLALSFFHARQQLLRWNIKSLSLLFKKKMLPSISIIAPAFNEEKTIIESANSLLNLKYPDYELIIVNDGSRDKTLDILIDYFDLYRVDRIFQSKLNAKPIRGVYASRSMPKLLVVDKENGGKADSLNVGINIASKEYFCGIDADSLLEKDALLKLASMVLDEAVETPAMGGNIFPINGCSVERGEITDFKIPGNSLAKFQTIEYIRAFMAGRVGWASINGLLIISGAFGLFRKERIIGIGGYLTSSGKYSKDTVGEDMELVVRISKLMRELNHNFKICYSYIANCWTQVPEDLGSLKKQRIRWHRGLIEILMFHKKMIFNPSYGLTGLIAMPYFAIFEMIGPMIEIQGYIMVVIALFLGLLYPEIALLLFISTILMGILISISSLLLSMKNLKNLKLMEILILFFCSIIENFGPRQLFSLWRVTGFISMLGKQQGWGKPQRKGFMTRGQV